MGDKGVSAGAGGSEGRKKKAAAPYVAPDNLLIRNSNVEALARQVEMFGKELSGAELAQLVGAQEGSLINVKYSGSSGGTLILMVENDNFAGAQQRWIKKDSEGNIFVYNASFKVQKNAPDGLGTKVFTDQVQGLRQMGIKKITVDAAGSPTDKDYNGYYTWPRMGYNGPVPTDVFIPTKIRDLMNGGNTIQDLYRTPEGREWWKKNGSSLNSLSFDTDPNSLNSRVLDAYNAERANRKKG